MIVAMQKKFTDYELMFKLYFFIQRNSGYNSKTEPVYGYFQTSKTAKGTDRVARDVPRINSVVSRKKEISKLICS